MPEGDTRTSQTHILVRLDLLEAAVAALQVEKRAAALAALQAKKRAKPAAVVAPKRKYTKRY